MFKAQSLVLASPSLCKVRAMWGFLIPWSSHRRAVCSHLVQVLSGLSSKFKPQHRWVTHSAPRLGGNSTDYVEAPTQSPGMLSEPPGAQGWDWFAVPSFRPSEVKLRLLGVPASRNSGVTPGTRIMSCWLSAEASQCCEMEKAFENKSAHLQS